ncbi:MAG: M14 family zinc carboxypeptidase, partial [Smithella sp.]
MWLYKNHSIKITPKGLKTPIYHIAVNKKFSCNQISKRKRIVLSCCFLSGLLFYLVSPSGALAYDSSSNDFKGYISILETQNALYGWTDVHPGEIPWEYYRTTKKGNPLIFVHFGKATGNCILFFGCVHGDELPSTYLMFKLAQYVKDNPALFENKCIVVAPLLNPDGFLSIPPTRVNANGIDINRNFPTKDWQANAMRQWI